MTRFARFLPLLSVLAGVATGVCGANPALGQPGGRSGDFSRVEALYGEGIAFYQAADYRQALERFREAYRVYPEPNLVYNIARCHEALGETDEAVRQYQAFLALPEGDAGARQKSVDKLAALLRQRDAGRRTPDVSRPVPPPRPTPPQPETEPTAAPVTVSAPPRAPASARWPEWTLLSVGAASVILGGVLWALQDDAADAWHREHESLDRKRELLAARDGYRTGSVALFGLGGAALISSGLLFGLRKPAVPPAAAGGAAVSAPPVALIPELPLVQGRGASLQLGF